MAAANRPKFNAFERALIQGAQEALRYARGEIKLTTTVYPIPAPPPRFSSKRLVALRAKLELTPDQFAAVLNVSCRAVVGLGERKAIAFRLNAAPPSVV